MTIEESKKYMICDTNQFWLHYLSLEKSLKEISEYVAIHESNKKVFSFKIMQLYFAVCSEIDSIFKHIRSNIPEYTNIKIKGYLNIEHHKKMIKDHFCGIEDTKVDLNISGYSLQFKPFEVLFNPHRTKTEEYNNEKFEGWWIDYNSVKHSRLNSFYKANLDNLLHSLSALHILNLVYAVSLKPELVKSYDSVLIEAPTTSHYPLFQLENSGSNRYTNSAHSYYASYLNNNSIR